MSHVGQPAEIPAAVLTVRQQIAVTVCISVVGVQVFIQNVHLGHPCLCIPPVPLGATASSGPGPPHYRGFTITLRQTTARRTPLDE